MFCLTYILCHALLQNRSYYKPDVGIPAKRRYTGALVDRQSLSAIPWKQKVLQMDLMPVDDISPLAKFQVTLLTFLHARASITITLR